MPLRSMSRQPVAIITGRLPITIGQTPAPVAPEVTPTQPVPATPTPVTCPDGYSVLGTGCIPNQVASLPAAPIIVNSTAGASALTVAGSGVAPNTSTPSCYSILEFGSTVTNCAGPLDVTSWALLAGAVLAALFLFGGKH